MLLLLLLSTDQTDGRVTITISVTQTSGESVSGGDHIRIADSVTVTIRSSSVKTESGDAHWSEGSQSQTRPSQSSQSGDAVVPESQ